jgi:hypothetical protein
MQVQLMTGMRCRCEIHDTMVVIYEIAFTLQNDFIISNEYFL